MTNTPFIEIKDLTVVYNVNTPYEVVALKDFSLQIEKGEILVITGDNGSGKSTLLRAICGTAPVRYGHIFINGTDVTKWSANRRARLLGTVHQDTMLGTCPNLSIQENFQLTNISKWWHPIPYKLRLNKGQVDNIKNTGLPLETRETSKINMLSGGQRQAIAVCLAFENKKPVLLFDEFISALDSSTIKNVLDFTFHKANEDNTTLLMILHNVRVLKEYADVKIKYINLS